MVKSVNVNQEAVLNAFIKYIHSLCSGFGRHITVLKVNDNAMRKNLVFQ